MAGFFPNKRSASNDIDENSKRQRMGYSDQKSNMDTESMVESEEETKSKETDDETKFKESHQKSVPMDQTEQSYESVVTIVPKAHSTILEEKIIDNIKTFFDYCEQNFTEHDSREFIYQPPLDLNIFSKLFSSDTTAFFSSTDQFRFSM